MAMAYGVDRSRLSDFFSKRERLIAELQSTARTVSAWWAEREQSDPTLHDLALLEGLLAERKRLLDQMMALDDDMLDELVKARAHSQTGH